MSLMVSLKAVYRYDFDVFHILERLSERSPAKIWTTNLIALKFLLNRFQLVPRLPKKFVSHSKNKHIKKSFGLKIIFARKS